MAEARSARVRILASMLIFGTLSIVVRGAELPSAVLALGRAIIGGISLILYSALRGRKSGFEDIRQNLKWLIPSGMMIGIDWVLLFEAFNYTSVAKATLCYYMEPIFLVFAAPFVFGEKLTPKKILSVFLALVGMAFVSGVTDLNFFGANLRGMLLALGAAALYAAIIVLNKCMGEIDSLDRVATQLIVSIPAVLIYIFVTGQFEGLIFTPRSLIWVLIAGIVHTGIAYVFLYGAVSSVSSQTVAILSYLDPAVAVLVSTFFFKEPLTLAVGIGAVLILGAAVISELNPKRRQ